MRLRLATMSVLVLWGLTGLGCEEAADPAPGFDDEQKTRALQLISVFENGTAELQYGYVEDLDDGRGFTCGLGFTTGTGDVLTVVERYRDVVGDNGLAPFITELQALAAAESDDTSNLAGFSKLMLGCTAESGGVLSGERWMSAMLPMELPITLREMGERGPLARIVDCVALPGEKPRLFLPGPGEAAEGETLLAMGEPPGESFSK